MVISFAFARVSRRPFCPVTRVVRFERSGVAVRSEAISGTWAMTAVAMAMARTSEGNCMMLDNDCLLI